MTEDEFLQPEPEIVNPPEPILGELGSPEVTFIVPAMAYQSIATDEGTVPIEPSTPDPNSTVLDALATLSEGLGRKLETLQTMFDREIRAEATREKVVDRLHAELQEYKQGLLMGILRPVFVDLIQLHDDMGKMIAARGDAEGEVAQLIDLIKGFQQGIEDILYRQGVEPFSIESESFDPRRQRALSTVTTDNPDCNKQVATRLRKGFQAGDKLIRPEMVTVFSFKEKAASRPDQAC